MKLASRFAATLLVLAPLGASAHPGHGEPGAGHTLAHWLGDPLHFVPLASALAAGTVLIVWRRRAEARRRRD